MDAGDHDDKEKQASKLFLRIERAEFGAPWNGWKMEVPPLKARAFVFTELNGFEHRGVTDAMKS